jgi:hypothetical protein
MPLSWNEIRKNAIRFSKDWENETSEDAEAQTFWNQFFQIFGMNRRRFAYFEKKVTTGKRKNGKIDLLWKGHLLVEHKSAGKDLDRAYQQAIDYFPGIKDNELPKYLVVCNFQKFRIYNLDDDTINEFGLLDLVNNIELFGFIAGYQTKKIIDEDPVNIEAAELMGSLHDRLKDVGYTGHSLELYLVRLLFCLFSDDSGIFERGIFQEYIELKTNEDGSDLAYHLSAIFQTLNTPQDKRYKNIDESLDVFPYVNGKLFYESLPMASFDSEMRKILLKCCSLNWGLISPAIFGSMFQSVMNPVERRHLGAHYTSEKNILKVIKSLFLDALRDEFKTCIHSSAKLVNFHNKLSKLKFLDPACGCGNFLVIAYREIRLLELEVLKVLFKKEDIILQHGVDIYCKIDVDQFYGIEIEEFPAQIAQVALWLMDHQMNMRISHEFGEYYIRLPLTKAANIIHENALRIEWNRLIDGKNDNKKFDYIFGNPPFVGKHLQDEIQKEDLQLVFNDQPGIGVLDYVTGWYIKTANYIHGTKTKAAFVSTNSISQGEQIGLLWGFLFPLNIKIHFAHRTFKWKNEGRADAAVYVIIIGFAAYNIKNKVIYDYPNPISEPVVRNAKNINPYLIDYKDFVLNRRTNPLSNIPNMQYGSKPVDGGFYMFTTEEKEQFLVAEPKAKSYFKRITGADEYINNIERWCLWLKDINPKELKSLPHVYERVKMVKDHRLKSKKQATKDKADTPTEFAEIRQPDTGFILFPLVSSENRKYIPIGFLNNSVIINNRCSVINNADLYLFGILTSEMHMSWTRCVSGRLEGRFNYSNIIVYNNFPFPLNPSKKNKSNIQLLAKKILQVRKEFSDCSLSDLYDPTSMPPKLAKVHSELDHAIDLCYRSKPFLNESERLEFLFELYEKYTNH